jgi:subtilisin family serine protease
MTQTQEMTFCCALGLAAFVTTLELNSPLEKISRHRLEGDPIVSTKPSEDSRLSSNWGLERIHAPQAWKQGRGSKEVLVAIIDTGCDTLHPDLVKSVWHNPGEIGLDDSGLPKQSNGIDDDDNGFVDDFQGWNFSEDSNDVTDDHGHGTHVAGIIGGIDGVAPRVSLMILKYYNPAADPLENLANTINAIKYAVNMGADIINYSAGGGVKNEKEYEVLKWAAEKGVLVVAAAGNEGLDSDYFPFYPADYDLPNILSVTATDQYDELLRTSNFGARSVALAAPGKNIYSTLPNEQHGYLTGSSQATAFATGVAALLMAHRPQMRNPKLLIDHLIKNSIHRQTLAYKVRSSAVLDAQMALENWDIQVTETE